MKISYEIILKKIEEKLNDARVSNREEMIREHVQAMKVLCEVLLEEVYVSKEKTSYKAASESINFEPKLTTSHSITSFGEKKIETDDGANGDSIFDF